MEVSSGDRIIVLVDMDCFYVQVEQKLCPEYFGKPCAVVQYKTYKGGGIIAVNYEARDRGVSKFIRGDEAKKICPEIHLFRVPEVRGKADLTRYREAGASVIDVLCEFSDCVERASIDEAYLDMTSMINIKMQNAPRVTAEQLQNTFVIGWEGNSPESRKEELEKWLQMIYEEEHLYNDRMLALAAVTVEEMRAAVYEKLGYRCSAGIAHNKMLAKLTCGIHKPNKQTLLPQSSIQMLFKTIPIKKVRNLGGKLGQAIAQKFNVEKMGDLIDVPKSQLVSHFGEKTGHWLYNLVRGVDNEPVTSRQLPKSIGCGKNFPGKTSLGTRNEVTYWLKQLATELEERLVKDQRENHRFARLLTISVRTNENGLFSSVSRSCPIYIYNAERLAHDALQAISKLNTSSDNTMWKPSIWTLSIAAGKFEDKLDNSHCNIESYFSNKNSSNKESLNRSESSLDKSVASTSTECCDINKTSELINNSGLKVTKTENANKSIISFFSKKQLSKSFGTDELISVNEHKTEENNELNSCLSVLSDLDDKSNDGTSNAEICSVSDSLKTDISSETSKPLGFFARTSNAETCSMSDNMKTDTSSEISKPLGFFARTSNAETCSVSDNMKTDTSSETSKPLGFFARTSNAETCSMSDNMKIDTSSEISKPLGFFARTSNAETCSVSDNMKIDTSSEASKPLGFFARKLKERSEFNLNIEFETSSNEKTDCVNGELENDKQSTSQGIPSHFKDESDKTQNFNDSTDLYADLDPELLKRCEQCNKKFPVWEESEHLDYHFALNMSKELSKERSINNSTAVGKSVPSKNVVTKSKVGRKRGSGTKSSAQVKKHLGQTKTLDAFFR